MKKIESIKEYIINKTLEEVVEMIEALKEEYCIPIKISKVELRIIICEFYNYYEKKELQYLFFEIMKGHFEDISITAIENKDTINSRYILDSLQLFELLDSPMDVDPRETRRLIEKVRVKIERRPRLLV